MPSRSIPSNRTFLKLGLIAGTVGVITLFHYTTSPEAGMRHVIFRELYFLPIILGGFWFGLRGGLSTSLIISILYGPLVLIGPDRLSPHDLGNTMEIFLFNLIGGLLGWLQDREKKQQAKLTEAERLAAMGRATAMISHDLKTPLITIAGLAKRLTQKISPNTSEGEKIQVIRQQAERLERLVIDMLFFARPIQLTLEDGNLRNLMIQSREAVEQIALGKKVYIELPAETSCSCQVDHEKMVLVFINLLTNAVEASPSGGTVRVLVVHSSGEVRIDFVDKGNGIPDNLLDKIFEPFVTGKQKGTGLGLPICRKIVEAHGGKISWSSNPGGGTTFSIVLHQF